MSTKHTPGPWSFCTSKNGWSYTINIYQSESAPYTPDWSDVAFCTCEGERKQIQEANARRIVACVNACEGISTENLEENKPIAWLAQQFNESVKQLDVLMKALRTISEESTDYEAREHALVAIAKATGEQQ